MTIYSNDGYVTSDDRKLALFHSTRNCPKRVVCTRDNPKMHGFGKPPEKGDVVTIEGTIYGEIGFAVSVPEQCAFYEYDAFEPTDNFFNAGGHR